MWNNATVIQTLSHSDLSSHLNLLTNASAPEYDNFASASTQQDNIILKDQTGGLDMVEHVEEYLDQILDESIDDDTDLLEFDTHIMEGFVDIPVQNNKSEFRLEKYTPASFITSHRPPATRRDDDITKLQEIIDEVSLKSGCIKETILCGLDNKIGSNLLKLTKQKKYEHMLPEFSVLHLHNQR